MKWKTFFKFKKYKNNINWMTVKCDNCSKSENPYIMYVKYDEMEVKSIGYKGLVRINTICTKCGMKLDIPEKDIPKNILRYIMKKAYKDGYIV